MIVTFVHVWVKPEMTEKFIQASVENHECSIKEPGNLRFDILRDTSDNNKFVLYEAYDSEEAAAAHKETSHYKKWRDIVADMMAQPRKGEKHIILCPIDKKLW